MEWVSAVTVMILIYNFRSLRLRSHYTRLHFSSSYKLFCLFQIYLWTQVSGHSYC